METTHKELTNNQLKTIAVVAMFSDHLGKILLPDLIILQILGRIAFPIFAFMIAEGWTHTRSKDRYMGQMALFAGLIQAGYFLALGSLYQSVLVTFSLSLVIMTGLDRYKKDRTQGSLFILGLILAAVVFISLFIPKMEGVGDFQVDYGLLGILFPVNIYLAQNKSGKLIASLIMTSALAFQYGGIQWYGLLAIPFLALYNGKRGKKGLKYLFYIFYPLHLLVLYGVKIWLKII